MYAPHILDVTANHPDEIKTVSFDLKALVLDQNRNEVIASVFIATYSTYNTNPVNWANTYGEDQANFLKEKADSSSLIQYLNN